MSQQVRFNSPNGDWAAIDNSAGSATTILNAGAPIGFDTPATVPVGATSQATNPFGDTGSTTLDTAGNDTVYADPSCATVVGNPVSNTQPTFKLVTTVLNTVAGQRLLYKNPA
jgi:hypothetical protein